MGNGNHTHYTYTHYTHTHTHTRKGSWEREAHVPIAWKWKKMHFKIFKNFIIKKHNSNLENQLYQIKDKFCFDSIHVFHEYKISNSQCS